MPSLKFNFILLSIGLLVTGCQMKPHSPWIFCILLGLAMTLVARQLLIGFKLRPHLPPAPVLYVCLLIVFTLAVWLAFFKN